MRFWLLTQLLALAWCQLEDFDPLTDCLVPDLNNACTKRCEVISLECIANCDADDAVCWSQCLRENGQCYNDCPCELNCLDGCKDCDNPICSCQVVDENPDWNRCIDENSIKLGRCVRECNENQECEADCLSSFKTRQLNCPCEENCSAGCPCSDFECTPTTSVPDITTATIPATTTPPAQNAVLVLSTYESSNKPMIIDFEGNINEDLAFEYGSGTQAHQGCGVTFQNEFWYFGGNSPNKRQASKIVGCKLERQMEINFDFYLGACNTFDQSDPIVLLCFGRTTNQECHTFDGELFQYASNSTYTHRFTYGLANYKGSAMTTGCQDNPTCYVKTEFMDLNTLKWIDGPDYPFTSSAMYRYSTVSTSEAAYFIGGTNTQEIIAEFKNDSWHQYGTLTKGRNYHGSILLDGEFMVIGGYSSDESALETEIWNVTTESNTVVDPILTNGHYTYGIGLYIVPFNFCTS